MVQFPVNFILTQYEPKCNLGAIACLKKEFEVSFSIMIVKSIWNDPAS